MIKVENQILVLKKEDVVIQESNEIKLAELKTGKPQFFEDTESFCNIYMISRVHINKTDFVLTPLWKDEDGNYHSKEGSNCPDRQDLIVPMNHNVFRNWLASPHAEYSDSYSLEDSPNNLTAAHVYSFATDDEYIHHPDTKYGIKWKHYN